MKKPSISEVFAVVDSAKASDFSQLFSHGGRMCFGNWDAFVGRESIEQGIGQFFETINSLHHTIANEWVVGEQYMAELSVTYNRLDGVDVTIPVFTMWRTNPEGLIEDYRVFLDLGPVFA